MTHVTTHLRVAATALATIVVVAACTSSTGAGGGASPTASYGPAPTAAATSTASPPGATAPGSPDASTPASPPAVTLDQPWASAPLADVTTREPFLIADHAGKVVIIETMAIWCSTCLVQQRDVQAALARLPADRVVYIVLDVDPNERADSLAAYQSKHGFAGRYAIAGSDVARALAAEFGDQVLNPPSTPMILVGTDGRVTLTDFGRKSPDEIVALVEAHGA